MNFLAHCSLAHDASVTWGCSSQERIGLLAGAVIGDFVKGHIPTHWPVPLQAGARLHRKVDALSNIHPNIRASSATFPDHLRRFAPIFIDMLADHSLARNWQDYYDIPLNEFSAQCYRAISQHENHLPTQAQRFVNYMYQQDLLANYDQWPHIAQGLQSVLRRLRRPDWFEEVERASQAVLDTHHRHFGEYYPELRNAWHEWNAFEVIAAQQNL